MPNINIDLDEAACAEIMRRYQLPTKSEAINLALRKLANEPSPFTPPTAKPMSTEEFLAHKGIGWDGDLDTMRRSRLP